MPRYVIDEAKLRANLTVLRSVADRADVKILLAQKAYSCAATYPLCAQYLAGTTASSLNEAKHGKLNFPGETHVFAPAFRAAEMDELLSTVDHIVFNSPRQVARFAAQAHAANVSVGLRVNPEVSVGEVAAYDPCRPGSRLGTTRHDLDAAPDGLALVDGLHFHALCEQGVEELRKVLVGFEANFGDLLPRMSWVNFGGGHHITRADYDVDGLVALLAGFKARHPHLAVYLEPGEAVALDAGTLESEVLEIQPRGADGIANAILDTSAACHMPDVLEMPYQPRLAGAAKGAAGKFPYRFGGPTCLAGDVIGTWSFDRALCEGDTVVFEDMAIYSMVKNNTFNGIDLPDIVLRKESGEEILLARFGYDDFVRRLG
jgi:carboxynorspermidine decarboxylase